MKVQQILLSSILAGSILITVPTSVVNATGWVQKDSNWYYQEESGNYKTGWQLLGDTWYYFDASGKMATNWTQINGAWYYFSNSGAMATGWSQQGSTWYYLTSSGAMATGWQFINGNWYYFYPNGSMAYGWQCLGGVWNYFDAAGSYKGRWHDPSTNPSYVATSIKGVDVSKWQGNIDWNTLKNSLGLNFAFIRLGHGSNNLDSNFAKNIDGASAAGLNTGVYYYLTSTSVQDAIKDAQFTIKNMQGHRVTYPVAVDVEDANLKKLGKETISAIALAYCQEIQRAGYTPAVYTYQNYANEYIDWSYFGGVPRWIAEYRMEYSANQPRDIWQAGSSTTTAGINAQFIDIDFGFTDYSRSVTPRTTAVAGYTPTKGIWQNNGRWWYAYLDGGYARNCWEAINGSWYHFDNEGYIQTGWINLDGTWYYLSGSGAMLTGWQYINGTWYYLSGSGAMLTGWQYINGTWYYLSGSGAMLTGWQYINGTWYYLSGSGAMLTGWQCINSLWYYLDTSGAMAANEWRDGYWLSSDGGWRYFATGKWYQNSIGKWYQDTYGWYPTSCEMKVDGVSYHFNAAGYLE
jgi:lysozyme